MTHIEAMAAIAQGVINIEEAKRLGQAWIPQAREDSRPLDVIEHGSRVFLGMAAIVEEEAKTIERLKEIKRRLTRRAGGDVTQGLTMLDEMIAERTDPEFARS